jgi:hypothetical protein
LRGEKKAQVFQKPTNIFRKREKLTSLREKNIYILREKINFINKIIA